MLALIICHEAHRFLVAEQVRQKNITISGIILKPMVKNTALAISIAAVWAKQQNTNLTLLVLPADHNIKEHDRFHQAIEQALVLAKLSFLVTFGITPTLEPQVYLSASSISFDHAIMEKTKQAAVVPSTASWCDIGNWHSLWKQGEKKRC